jgi:hypothetical protein
MIHLTSAGRAAGKVWMDRHSPRWSRVGVDGK